MMFTDSQNANSNDFIFREIRNEQELLELLRLRYGVYKESRLNVILKENSDEIEVDVFDAKSRHYGVFNRNRIVGGIRVVEPFLRPSLNLIESLSQRFKSIESVLSTSTRAALPCATYYDPENSLGIYVDDLLASGKRLVEPSRLVLEPKIRDAGLAKQIVEAAIGFYFFGSRIANTAALICSSTQKRFYKSYGFSECINQIKLVACRQGPDCSLLVAQLDNVPLAQSVRIDRLSQNFKASGQLKLRHRRHFRATGVEISNADENSSIYKRAV